MNTTATDRPTSSTLIPAALLVAADRNAHLDADEQMSVLEAVMEARNVLRLPEAEPVMGAWPLDEDDADDNPTTRAYRTILEATPEDLNAITFDDEFIWSDQGGAYAVGITDERAVLASCHEIYHLALTPWMDFDLPTNEYYQAENPTRDKILWRAVEGEAYPDKEVWWVDDLAYFVEEIDAEAASE
ncbi:hypothetical protein QE375_001578 [Microbacterium foliorum]|uniref:Uncharacterized protein n=2 Tax=Bacteria TaxID=2 RepID=A0ABU1HRU3_9MICO|nr:hypothetical protein [Microbacterium foliorum]MDR6142024.1 hypothetical protein [Microbacterium foliorum]